jgi:acetyltransferase-like isoleucine patch superfamily enzyme
MTAKELRDAGELYDANYDKRLLKEMEECKDKCHVYNSLLPSDLKAKTECLGSIVSRMGAGCRIMSPFWCDYGYNIVLGDNFYANHGLVVLDAAKVTFGDNVFVGPGCGFYTAGHPLDAERRNVGLEYAKPITVGDNVWIGGNCTILPGVTIGEGSVVAAGAVVAKDVPPRTVVGGIPAKVIKKI